MCYCNPGCECDCKRQQDEPKLVPHKHAALIKAWADGAKIQRRLHPEDEWIDTGQPNWSSVVAYRVKPVKLPDIIKHAYICCGVNSPNNLVEYVYDNETEKLKSVRIIK